MRAYEDVPRSWYWAMIGVNFAASAVLVSFAPLQVRAAPGLPLLAARRGADRGSAFWQTPIWCLVLAIALAVGFLVPIGIVSAISGTTVGLNVVTEFLIGVLRPGRPIGNIFFKVRLLAPTMRRSRARAG